MLRRLLMDQDEFRGEVIFTFDGDAAGQKAAMRAFQDDQKFVTQTFVAVEPNGLDPCDLRVTKGDAAVRDLVEHRIPLAEFAIRTVLVPLRPDHPRGPGAGARRGRSGRRPAQGPRPAARVRPPARRLARHGRRHGADPGRRGGRPARTAETAVARQPHPRRASGRGRPAQTRTTASCSASARSLKIAMQRPVLAGPVFDGLEPEMFTSPAYRLVRAAIAAVGGVSSATAGGQDWIQAVTSAAPNDFIKGLATELAVEPILTDREVDAALRVDAAGHAAGARGVPAASTS